MAASAARIRNPGRPEVCRKIGLMSGVLTKKFGRKNSRSGPVESCAARGSYPLCTGRGGVASNSRSTRLKASGSSYMHQ